MLKCYLYPADLTLGRGQKARACPVLYFFYATWRKAYWVLGMPLGIQRSRDNNYPIHFAL